MKHWIGGIIIVVLAVVAVGAGTYHFEPQFTQRWGAFTLNWFTYLRAPNGTLQTQEAPGPHPPVAVPANLASYDTGKDWAGYNKTLTSNRFSSLAQINRSNVSRLKVLCTFKTGQHAGFNTGLVEVQGKLLFTTTFDTYAIDPNDCRQIWDAHEDYTPASVQHVNRGVAVMDGRVFRGTQDGRVIAYDLNTGRRLWQTTIANVKKGEVASAAPIAWNGMVFEGTGVGDLKGNRERMYGIDAATGKVRWEFYMVPRAPGDPQYGPEAPSPLNRASWGNPPGVPISGGGTWTSYTLDPQSGLLYIPGGNPSPDFALGVRKGPDLLTGSVVILDAKTGAYRGDFKLVPLDWHDYDISSAPALIHTAGGRTMLVEAPKDGHLYGIDLGARKLLYKVPVTTIENPRVPFQQGKAVHFCPGSVGGAEWNGASYDPATNLVLTGEIDWCAAVKLQPPNKIIHTPDSQPWSAEASSNPFNTWGKFDKPFNWAGWLYATDADTGQWLWRARSNYPIQSGVTPTGGGLVFFGDMGGNFYAVDANSGHELWHHLMDGAVGGGVITYDAGQGQRVAAATGLTEVIWPTKLTTAKVVVMGL